MTFDVAQELKHALTAIGPELRELVRHAVRAELAAFDGDPSQLLTAEDAAPLLGTTSGALRQAAARGTCVVPPVRVGRRLRWRRGDITAYVASQRECG